MVKTAKILREEGGQTTVEYVLMLGIIVALTVGVIRAFNEQKIASRLTAPLRKEFAAAYQWGSPKAKGGDDGAFHQPLVREGDNFRVFITNKDAP